MFWVYALPPFIQFIFDPSEIWQVHGSDFNSSLHLDITIYNFLLYNLEPLMMLVMYRIFPRVLLNHLIHCKEIWFFDLTSSLAHKYWVFVLNEFLKLQIDNWSTSSIDFFHFTFMPGYFNKIKMIFLKTDFW